MPRIHQPPPKKRRGGQPGNANAIKHGFYTRHFRGQEIKVLDQLPVAELQDEMEALRAFLRRYLKELDTIAPGDLRAAQNALFTACLVSSQLTAMARVQARGGIFAAESRLIREWAKALVAEEREKTQKEGA
jgi:hypothetical protein